MVLQMALKHKIAHFSMTSFTDQQLQVPTTDNLDTNMVHLSTDMLFTSNGLMTLT